MDNNNLIGAHGGYRKLLSFQISQLIYDITVRFCAKYLNYKSRTNDQMVQAARSGVQNIAEGSQASGTSKKTELKLTNVARASLEELKLDYEDYLRQNSLLQWEPDYLLRHEIINKKFQNADAVADWVKEIKLRYSKNQTQEKYCFSYDEITANTVLVLLGVASSLLRKQLKRLASDFESQGGLTEKLYRVRSEHKHGK